MSVRFILTLMVIIATSGVLLSAQNLTADEVYIYYGKLGQKEGRNVRMFENRCALRQGDRIKVVQEDQSYVALEYTTTEEDEYVDPGMEFLCILKRENFLRFIVKGQPKNDPF